MSEVEWLKIFSRNLEDLMLYTIISPAELAEETGLNLSTIYRYLNAECIPSVKAIINLSAALNVEVGELIDFGDTIE